MGFARPVSWLGQQLWPEFAELPVGLMAFTLIVMVLLESNLQTLILDALYSGAGGLFGIFLLNLVVAIAHALYHVFSHKRKSDEEKRAMVGFAAICCITSGILGGYRLYLEQSSLIQLFGIWNVVQGMAIALLFHAKAINATSIPDEEAPLAGTIANFFVIGSLYIILKYGCGLHYIDNFSICVAYAMSLSSTVCGYIYNDSHEDSD